MNIQDLTKSDTMATPDEIVKATIANVETSLKEIGVDYVAFGDGSFTTTHGSASVMIIVRPFTEYESCVQCVAHVVTGATMSPALMNYLLRKNAELNFGAFGLLFDDTITFSYTLPGSNLNLNELYTAVKAVSVIADEYDDEIVALAGGKRAADAEITDLELS